MAEYGGLSGSQAGIEFCSYGAYAGELGEYNGELGAYGGEPVI